ncbi:hypothetical protein V2W30_41320 (plasmid) [Streptomyces sp. Q6]|uniref:Uncharacterized protein n=1 Tax=Streptomyces citrinus TaxID=3118173 RepID=A0ACD5ARR0_9ACTN
MNDAPSHARHKPAAQHDPPAPLRRPQRTLTPAEHEVVRRTALLNL